MFNVLYVKVSVSVFISCGVLEGRNECVEINVRCFKTCYGRKACDELVWRCDESGCTM